MPGARVAANGGPGELAGHAAASTAMRKSLNLAELDAQDGHGRTAAETPRKKGRALSA